MKRVVRWTLNALTALSLLLCVATVGLWVRSYRVIAEIEWWSAHPNNRQWLLAMSAEPGCLFWSSQWRDTATAPPNLQARYMFPPGLQTHLREPIGNAVTFDQWEQRWAPTGAAWRRFGLGVRWRDRAIPYATNTDIVLSFGWLVLAFAVLPARRALRLIIVRTRRRYRGSRPLCRRCSYDLTGNVSGVCPECGTAVAEGVA